MVNWLEVGLDAIIVGASLGLSYYGYRLLRFFRKGIFQRAFEFLICSALVFVAAESFHILEMVTKTGVFEAAHIMFEVAFVLLMFHSFNLLYKAWVPIEKHRKQQTTTISKERRSRNANKHAREKKERKIDL